MKNGELAYEDKYTLEELIEMLKIRIIEIHRILKPTGSFYIHGDYRFMPYIRIICDEIFGINNLRNEIVWCYSGISSLKSAFIRQHDTIYFYSKTDDYIFNYDNIRVDRVRKLDKTSGKGLSKYSHVMSDEELANKNKKGKIPRDWWDDFGRVPQIHKENLGYPTQKPEKLLARILKASLPYDFKNKLYKGLVVDLFCGSGTTLKVAKDLGVDYIGCDNSDVAVKISKERIVSAEYMNYKK